MSTEPTFQTEPEAPVIEPFRGRPTEGGTERPNLRTVQGAPALPDHSGYEQSEADRQGWQRELEERRSRPINRLPESAAIDVVTELDAELARLETAAQAFERDFGQPNGPLIAAKQLVADLEAKLAVAKLELAAIEAKGDSVSRLRTSIQWAESTLLGLYGSAEQEIVQSLIDDRLGPGVAFAKIPTHLKDEVRLNSRVRGLSAFRTIRSVVSRGDVSTDELLRSLNIAGEKLVALRDYIIVDRQQKAKQ